MSVLPRRDSESRGRVRRPRPRGDQGILPTPKSYQEKALVYVKPKYISKTHLESREHLTLLFAVDQAMVVLHGDERRQLVVDRVVYKHLSAQAPYLLPRVEPTLHSMDCTINRVRKTFVHGDTAGKKTYIARPSRNSFRYSAHSQP